MGKLLSVTEAAERLGVSRQRVHKLISLGLLKADRIGNALVLDEDQVEQRKKAAPKSGRPPK